MVVGSGATHLGPVSMPGTSQHSWSEVQQRTPQQNSEAVQRTEAHGAVPQTPMPQ